MFLFILPKRIVAKEPDRLPQNIGSAETADRARRQSPVAI